MQVDTHEFLQLVEGSSKLATFDLESTGTKGDYNSVLVVSVKPYRKPVITLSVDRPGDDRRLVREARDLLSQYNVWVSYYGKGFDVLMLNTRLTQWHMKPLPKVPHLDLYFVVRHQMLTARRSMAHLSEALQTKHQKFTVSPEIWNLVLRNPTKGLRVLRKRCAQDCIELEDLYDRIKHLVANISR